MTGMQVKSEYILQTVTWREDREAQARGMKELIRCKDCKYSKFVDWGMNDCTHPQGLKGIAYSNSYCDRAERGNNDNS